MSTPPLTAPRARRVLRSLAQVPRLLGEPSWALALVGAILLSVVFVLLGRWQFARHEARVDRRDQVQAVHDLSPVPLAAVLPAPRTPLRERDEWRPVTAHGRYLTTATVLVRNRPLDGDAGYEVLVPLRLDSGAVLLVDRGWVPAGATARGPDAVPAPPAGEVTVQVRLRPSEPPSHRRWVPGQAAGIDIPRIDRQLPEPLYRAYGILFRERPAAAVTPTPLPRPDVGLGPHLAYSVQWWAFALTVPVLLAVAGVREVDRRQATDQGG